MHECFKAIRMAFFFALAISRRRMGANEIHGILFEIRTAPILLKTVYFSQFLMLFPKITTATLRNKKNYEVLKVFFLSITEENQTSF